MLIYNKKTFILIVLFLSLLFVMGVWLPLQFKNEIPCLWDVKLNEEGAITVFGVRLGKSSLKEAESKVDLNENLVSGKVYFFLSDSQYQQVAMLQAGTRFDASKALADNKKSDKLLPVQSIIFFPKQLKKNALLAHFGMPRLHFKRDQYEHLVYPHLGIDVLQDREGKLVINYFLPKDLTKILISLEKNVKNLA